MTPARHAFLAGLVDYAGLFPPARLALGPALGTYARHRAEPEAWMLGRFIVPAADLDAVGEWMAGEPAAVGDAPAREPLRLSVLGLPGAALEAALRTLEAARAFEAAHAALACDRFEFRVDEATTADARALGALAEHLAAALEAPAATGERPRAALEADLLAPGTAARFEALAAAVAEANGRAGRPALALKLRCGGVTPGSIPPPEAVAAALDAARRADVPFKATAGLHHPFRHDDDALGPMHGFVNVFGGAILARLHGLDAAALAELLDDRRADRFVLDDVLAWRRLAAGPAEIADARAQFALSYGSCSFDEPRDDLRALGWL
ncbi:MAG: hypothetical protein ACK41D_00055 [Rubricoccaceae bacterium]